MDLCVSHYASVWKFWFKEDRLDSFRTAPLFGLVRGLVIRPASVRGLCYYVCDCAMPPSYGSHAVSRPREKNDAHTCTRSQRLTAPPTPYIADNSMLHFNTWRSSGCSSITSDGVCAACCTAVETEKKDFLLASQCGRIFSRLNIISCVCAPVAHQLVCPLSKLTWKRPYRQRQNRHSS